MRRRALEESPAMRFAPLIIGMAALALAAVSPLHADDTVSGPAFNVIYFEVAPTDAAQTAAAARTRAEAAAKEDGHLAFEVFQEIARPSRFAIIEVRRDTKTAEAH